MEEYKFWRTKRQWPKATKVAKLVEEDVSPMRRICNRRVGFVLRRAFGSTKKYNRTDADPSCRKARMDTRWLQKRILIEAKGGFDWITAYWLNSIDLSFRMQVKREDECFSHEVVIGWLPRSSRSFSFVAVFACLTSSERWNVSKQRFRDVVETGTCRDCRYTGGSEQCKMWDEEGWAGVEPAKAGTWYKEKVTNKWKLTELLIESVNIDMELWFDTQVQGLQSVSNITDTYPGYRKRFSCDEM